MILQIIWFVLWGILWAVYFMLDGFDFGVGMLNPFLGRTESEKKFVVSTIGPVWNGNEVWLITAGGATFAAFPTTYALMFSYLYLPLLLILFGLIFRGVAIEFRNKIDQPVWKMAGDSAIFIGSFLPSLLFGVAFGNIFQGLPIDASGYHGNLLTLLNPYGLLTGILFLLLFLVHGSIYIAMKTEGDLRKRAERLGLKLWTGLLVVAVAFLALTNFKTNIYLNFINNPVLLLLPITAVVALISVRPLLAKTRYAGAFFASCLTILLIVLTGVAGLYPNLIPSSLDRNYSLTIFNSSSSTYTLTIMTIVALIFVPVVIAYQIWVHRVFKGTVNRHTMSGY
jgi:cytochrome d ubiquinol oxidase subunit II